MTEETKTALALCIAPLILMVSALGMIAIGLGLASQ